MKDTRETKRDNAADAAIISIIHDLKQMLSKLRASPARAPELESAYQLLQVEYHNYRVKFPPP